MDIEWEPLIEAASARLVTPTLGYALQGRGDLPHRVADYLDGVLFLNRERNRSILDGLDGALEALRSADIEPVLMKGGASIVSGLYPDLGMRVIGDIDILIAESRAAEAVSILTSLGFDATGNKRVDYAKHHHLSPLHDPSSGLTLEVHLRPLANQWQGFLGAHSVLNRARRVPFQGRAISVPSPTHRVIQNIVHSQLADGNRARRRLDVRQLLELAALVRRYADEIDWAVVRETFAANAKIAVLQDSVEIMKALFDTRAHTSIGLSGTKPLAKLQAEVQRSDVSWLADRFVRASRTRPRAILKLLMPRAWIRLFKAMRSDMRAERW